MSPLGGGPATPTDGAAATPPGGAPEVPGPRRRRKTQGSAGPSRSADDVEVGEDGLPKRVRQRSLAPQLRRPPEQAVHRSGPPAGDLVAAFGRRAAGSGDAAPGDRTPEEIRARMSALQAGTARGRQEGSTGTVPPPETGDTGEDA